MGRSLTPSHAPSTRPGACDPCANGDHAGCDEIHIGDAGGGIDTLCTCYDDSWEWHEEIGRRVVVYPEPGGPTA